MTDTEQVQKKETDRNTNNNNILSASVSLVSKFRSLLEYFNIIQRMILSILGMNRKIVSSLTCCFDCQEERNEQLAITVDKNCHKMRRIFKAKRRNSDLDGTIPGLDNLEKCSDTMEGYPNKSQTPAISIISDGQGDSVINTHSPLKTGKNESASKGILKSSKNASGKKQTPGNVKHLVKLFEHVNGDENVKSSIPNNDTIMQDTKCANAGFNVTNIQFTSQPVGDIDEQVAKFTAMIGCSTTKCDRPHTSQVKPQPVENIMDSNQSANTLLNMILREHNSYVADRDNLPTDADDCVPVWYTDTNINSDKTFKFMEAVPPSEIVKKCEEYFKGYYSGNKEPDERVLSFLLKRLHQYLIVNNTVVQGGRARNKFDITALLNLEHFKIGLYRKIYLMRKARYPNITFKEFRDATEAKINRELRQEYANYKKRNTETTAGKSGNRSQIPVPVNTHRTVPTAGTRTTPREQASTTKTELTKLTTHIKTQPSLKQSVAEKKMQDNRDMKTTATTTLIPSHKRAAPTKSVAPIMKPTDPSKRTVAVKGPMSTKATSARTTTAQRETKPVNVEKTTHSSTAHAPITPMKAKEPLQKSMSGVCPPHKPPPTTKQVTPTHVKNTMPLPKTITASVKSSLQYKQSPLGKQIVPPVMLPMTTDRETSDKAINGINRGEQQTASSVTEVQEDTPKKRERRRRRSKKNAQTDDAVDILSEDGTTISPVVPVSDNPSVSDAIRSTRNEATTYYETGTDEKDAKTEDTITFALADHTTNCTVCEFNKKFGGMDGLEAQGYDFMGILDLCRTRKASMHSQFNESILVKHFGRPINNMESMRVFIDGCITVKKGDSSSYAKTTDGATAGRQPGTEHRSLHNLERFMSGHVPATGDACTDGIPEQLGGPPHHQRLHYEANNQDNNDIDVFTDGTDASPLLAEPGSPQDIDDAVVSGMVSDDEDESEVDEENELPSQRRRRLRLRRSLELPRVLDRVHEEGANGEQTPEKPQVYIPDGATFDFSRLVVEPGHGDKPNKKKLQEEIKEKVKTKGKPNKHLEKERTSYDQYNYGYEDDEGCFGDGPTSPGIKPRDEAVGGEEPEVEPSQGEDVLTPLPLLATELPQTIDDREFNMVPEEILRKEDTKLKDLEDKYTVSSPAKKDRQRKRKEKKSKGTSVTSDFFK